MFIVIAIVFAGVVLLSSEDSRFDCIEQGGHYDQTTEKCIKE